MMSSNAMPVFFRSELFTSYVLTIFKQWHILPSIWETAKYSYQCISNITDKNNLLKTSGPQIWLRLFTFRPIAPKQLNSLTTIGTLGWLGGAEVTHPLLEREVLDSIRGSDKGFYVWFFLFVVFVVF